MEEALKVYRIGRGAAELVGFLGRNGEFIYDRGYLSEPRAQPISQSLPFSKHSYAVQEAFSYFEGLVPEGAARRSMAAELRVREDDYVSMLAYCGLDCVGDLAITRGELPLPPAYEPIAAEELARALARPEGAAELNGSNRLSLAGTQNKVGLAHLPNTALDEGWLRPKNSAASTHILKVGARDEVLFFEYLCMRAARVCGVRAARTSLLEMDVPVICSERFDRISSVEDGRLCVVRLHQEDLTQAFGLTSGSKYVELAGGSLSKIAHFLRAVSESPIEDVEALARLTCFNYLIGNCDNHLKNLSLLYSEDWSEIHLAPAYDLVCTAWFPDLSRHMGMAINGIYNIDAVTTEDIRALSGELGVPAARLRQMCQELSGGIEAAVLQAGEEAPVQLDEVLRKAEDLIEDLASRREILSKV